MVNELVPIGLISLGAPTDEYDCYTNKLFSILINKKMDKHIGRWLLKKMTAHFGLSKGEAFKLKMEIENFARKIENWRDLNEK